MLSKGAFGGRTLQFLHQGEITAAGIAFIWNIGNADHCVSLLKNLVSKSAQTYFHLHSACGSQIERNSNFNSCKVKMKIKPWCLLKQMENQLDSLTEKPIHFLRLQSSLMWLVKTQIPGIFSVFMVFLSCGYTSDVLLAMVMRFFWK